MIGVLRTRRIVAIGVVVLLAVAACGDDDAADPERFCEIEAELWQLDDEFFGNNLMNAGGASPDEARETVGEARNLIDEMATVAPDEIRPSVDMAVDLATQVFDLIEEADFYALQVDQTELATVLETAAAEVIAAGDDLGEWIDDNCSFG